MSVRSGQGSLGDCTDNVLRQMPTRPSQKSPGLLPTLLVQHHMQEQYVHKKSSSQEQQGLYQQGEKVEVSESKNDQIRTANAGCTRSKAASSNDKATCITQKIICMTRFMKGCSAKSAAVLQSVMAE